MEGKGICGETELPSRQTQILTAGVQDRNQLDESEVAEKKPNTYKLKGFGAGTGLLKGKVTQADIWVTWIRKDFLSNA